MASTLSGAARPLVNVVRACVCVCFFSPCYIFFLFLFFSPRFSRLAAHSIRISLATMHVKLGVACFVRAQPSSEDERISTSRILSLMVQLERILLSGRSSTGSERSSSERYVRGSRFQHERERRRRKQRQSRNSDGRPRDRRRFRFRGGIL